MRSSRLVTGALLLGACAPVTGPLPAVRLTAAEIDARTRGGAGTGTSGVAGIETIVLEGDVEREGPYMIEIRVPAHTKIEAHSHPDDRSATVVSGTWFFGYGNTYDSHALKVLPPGSFYTEPANRTHFAQTGDSPVVVHVVGHGRSGTTYAVAR